MAIRQAADHGLAAPVLVGREQLPVTSLRLADLTDPDTRFALHLACRVRLLHH